MTCVSARWVFPGDSPPLEDAVLEIDQGRIKEVRKASAAEVRVGRNIAVIPALINAHTHLEFGDLSQPIEPRRDFARWIEAVIAHRREQRGDPLDSVRAGLDESRRLGVTGLAEIATSDWLTRMFADAAGTPEMPRLVVFREILGLGEEDVGRNVEIARRFLERGRTVNRAQSGLSPHAPYSLHPQLFTELCALAKRERAPVAMHLAESRAELKLLATGTGELVELLSRMGLWKQGIIPSQTRPLDYLKQLAALPRVLVIHGNFLDESEIEFLAAQPQMSVVYCPRTHAAMQGGEHPWPAMLKKGVNVTLGTDSRASNPDLSIWQELRFLSSQHPRIPASQLLELATVNAARALGWEDQGRLAPGQLADLCTVRLSPQSASDPEGVLFSCDLTRVMQAGRWGLSTDAK